MTKIDYSGADTANVEMMIEGIELGITRYGAMADFPGSACSVLRAKAAAHGIELEKASPVNLTAAAIGAEAWSVICRTSSLDTPSRYGPSAVRALAAILTRSAGQSLDDEEWIPTGKCATSPELIRAAESHGRWALKNLAPEDASLALRRAARDLYTEDESTFSSYAQLLTIVADSLEMPFIFNS